MWSIYLGVLTNCHVKHLPRGALKLPCGAFIFGYSQNAMWSIYLWVLSNCHVEHLSLGTLELPCGAFILGYTQIAMWSTYLGYSQIAMWNIYLGVPSNCHVEHFSWVLTNYLVEHLSGGIRVLSNALGCVKVRIFVAK